MRHVPITVLALGLLFACNKEEEPEPFEYDPPGVMRDCEAGPGIICPWAGSGSNGFNGDEVHRLDAWFSYPTSVHFSPHGPPAIADWNNHKIRLVMDAEEDGFETVMGTSFLGDGDPDKLDMTVDGAPGTTVNLNHPTQQQYFGDQCPEDLRGKLLSASWHTHKLRTWDPDTGRVHVMAGKGAGWAGEEHEEPTDQTLFNQPRQILIDSACDIYVLDMRNERIRKIDLDAWTTTTIAGNGTKGYGGDGGPALDASFNFPKNDNPEPGGYMVLNADETLMYVADTESHVIRVIDLAEGTIDLLAGGPGQAGDVDGDGLSARFDFPTGMAIDTATNELFVADANNHKIRVIDLDTGVVSTFAGTGEASCPVTGQIVVPRLCENQHLAGDGGPAVEATLYRPFGVDLDLDGHVVISDSYNNRFRIVYR